MGNQKKSEKKKEKKKMVKFVADKAEWDALMETSTTNLVVVDFTASWCPPCKMIAPHFEQLATEYPDAEFVKVDVDENSEVAGLCGISAMPTFQFFKNGSKVDDMCGADLNKLKALVKSNM